MADTTWPTTSDSITEAALLRALKRTANAKDYVVASGDYKVTAATGLTVDIAAGEAFVNGKFVKRDSATLAHAVAANSTLYVYVAYTASQNGITIANTTTAPDTETGWAANPERLLLAKVVTGASTVTSVEDKRNRVATSGWGASS